MGISQRNICLLGHSTVIYSHTHSQAKKEKRTTCPYIPKSCLIVLLFQKQFSWNFFSSKKTNSLFSSIQSEKNLRKKLWRLNALLCIDHYGPVDYNVKIDNDVIMHYYVTKDYSTVTGANWLVHLHTRHGFNQIAPELFQHVWKWSGGWEVLELRPYEHQGISRNWKKSPTSSYNRKNCTVHTNLNYIKYLIASQHWIWHNNALWHHRLLWRYIFDYGAVMFIKSIKGLRCHFIKTSNI